MEERNKDSTHTEVDFGEDLLESTALLGGEPALSPPADTVALGGGIPLMSSDASPAGASSPVTKDAISEALDSAKILIQEGFFEDAKRILRRILLKQPRHVTARKRLEEIQDEELKRLLSSREAPHVPIRRNKVKSEAPEDPEQVMRDLDRDLGLGLFSGAEPTADFRNAVEKALQGKKPQTCADFAVALLEMGQHPLAYELLEKLIQNGATELGVHVLAAEALFRMGRPFDVILRLDPMLANPDLPRARKTELFYLFARAHQVLDREEEALKHFRSAAAIEPRYRDVDERIRAILERKLRSK